VISTSKFRAVGLSIILAWGWKRAAIALAAGMLSAFSMAPFNAWPVLFFTFPSRPYRINALICGRPMILSRNVWWISCVDSSRSNEACAPVPSKPSSAVRSWSASWGSGGAVSGDRVCLGVVRACTPCAHTPAVLRRLLDHQRQPRQLLMLPFRLVALAALRPLDVPCAREHHAKCARSDASVADSAAVRPNALEVDRLSRKGVRRQGDVHGSDDSRWHRNDRRGDDLPAAHSESIGADVHVRPRAFTRSHPVLCELAA